MIVVSSFRPFPKCSNEIAENQKRAFKSWLLAFDRIVYFGERCSELDSIKSEFIPCESKPTIRDMALEASQFDGWSAIVNADIVVTTKIYEVEWKLNRHHCKCAMSHRFDLQSGMMIDNGLDFFAGLPEAWKALSKTVPHSMCIGRCLWDTWAMTFMAHEFRVAFADVTGMKFCFHPKHGERIDQNFDAPKDDFYLKNCKLPSTMLY